MSNYGTVNEGNAFFDTRLHAFDWDNASVEDRGKALVQATELIDQFDYVGRKYTVQVAVDALGDVDLDTDENRATLRAAELAQELEFPRGDSAVIPTEIETATYLIAKALLSGRDPDADLEALSTKATAYGDIRTTYNRDGNHQEHVAHLIPSPQAFNLLRPFLREHHEFDSKRI
jgi:hypothetical protein